MSHDPNCVFCKIIAGTIPSIAVAEDDLCVAFMDINPANPGHCLVVPREHAPTLFDVTPESLAAATRMAQRVARAVWTTLRPDGLNLLQANGPGAAQSVLHFHVHVLPRRNGDNLLMNWGLRPGDRDAIASAAEAIRNALSSP